ncbi:MAG: hypothetical protein IJZ92_00880 [Bacteroidaceae bacterium]|nr:hypothetical protein [Bacteroidaceae bacterium]
MKIKLLLFSTALLLGLASCTTIKRTADTVNIDAKISQYPTVADLEVHKKVEVTKTWNFRPFHIGEPKMKYLKGNMIAEILKEAGADVLLEPQIIYSRTSFGERKYTISGYPATFKNFRKATKADLEALKTEQPEHERTVYNVSQPWYKRIFRSKK